MTDDFDIVRRFFAAWTAGDLEAVVALVDPETNWGPMDEVYNTFFPKNRPARSYFGSTGFRRRGQLLQIDCIAYVD